MRLFVAVDVDPEAARAIAAFRDALKKQVGREAPSARITWVRDDQLHITLRFIGHVDAAQCASIQDALRPPLDVQPFDVLVGGAGAFPPRGAPRVLWVGIEKGGEALAPLEATVSGRLESCGVERESRAYRPHITLARIRESEGLRTPALFDGAAGHRVGGWRVDAITLYESRPSARGHEYVPLQRTDLRWKSF